MSYPFQEAAFFGNLFVSPPAAYYCNGRGVSRGAVPGRLGAAQAGSPYQNPFGDPGQCESSCVSSTATHSEVHLFPAVSTSIRWQVEHRSDGYTSCGSWPRVVTVYRDFDPASDYKLCNRSTGLCMGTRAGSSAPGPIDQYAYTGQPGQRFRLTRVARELTSRVVYSLCLAGPATCVAVVNGDVQAAATALYSWALMPAGGGYTLSNITGSLKLAVANGSTAEGARVVLSSSASDPGVWTILPVD
jgi:hypothetical protein